MDRYSFLNAAHTAFFAELYDEYLQNPDSIEPSWRSFFQGFDFANEYSDGPVEQLSNAYADSGNTKQLEQFQKEFAVLKLIDHYRTYGHLVTKTNPLRDRNVVAPDLSIQNFGLTTADLNIKFEAAKSVQLPVSTLAEIIKHLEQVYCHTLGIEFKYICLLRHMQC